MISTLPATKAQLSGVALRGFSVADVSPREPVRRSSRALDEGSLGGGGRGLRRGRLAARLDRDERGTLGFPGQADRAARGEAGGESRVRKLRMSCRGGSAT
jgi:hypothetical protein